VQVLRQFMREHVAEHGDGAERPPLPIEGSGVGARPVLRGPAMIHPDCHWQGWRTTRHPSAAAEGEARRGEPARSVDRDDERDAEPNGRCGCSSPLGAAKRGSLRLLAS
jgi:hypothetical protein